MCCACGRIRRLATKNGIRNYCCTLIAWIIRGKLLYLPLPRRPWLELARISHHSLDIVTPPAALLPIEDHIRYRNLRHLRLTGSLKGNRPDQVVSIINRLAPSDRISRHCLGIWFRLGPAGRCCGLLCHMWEAMPRSSLRCTLAVLCRNLGRPRGVRGPLLGRRQFADRVLEKAYLQPRQNSYGLGCDREPSRERGSRRLLPSTSTSNRAQAKYCVGCRTRQKERKQQLLQQTNSTWPPTSVVIACSSLLAHRWRKRDRRCN